MLEISKKLILRFVWDCSDLFAEVYIIQSCFGGWYWEIFLNIGTVESNGDSAGFVSWESIWKDAGKRNVKV